MLWLYSVQISDDIVAKDIFKDIADRGFISKFELEEPLLNDIFIEKVGAIYE